MKKVVRRGVRPLPMYQWCIKETFLLEALNIPDAIKIDEISFEIGFSLKRTVSTISSALRELGVSYLREPAASMEAQGTLTGARNVILRNAREIARILNLDVRHMRVKRLKVSHNGSAAVFTRMGKKMPDEEGKTRSVKVLAMVLAPGRETSELKSLIKAITADKIKCTFSIQPQQAVICTKE